jgi:Mannosylglycerate hydrolase MGH1-like glycoside hydrolase domain
MSAEFDRLEGYRTRKSNWKHWGPYLSERAWGTVREDYSEDGDAWSFFPFEHATARCYRWGEDGLAGFSDRSQFVCLSWALWNGKDPILKERMFGLTNKQGNHGEDVKEYYFYLDSTPTHSYAKMLYKYPQAAFPYEDLIAENGRRGFLEPEYELLDTGVFENDRYFDVFFEYAKAEEEDLCGQATIINRGDQEAEYLVAPQVWFRNEWSWGYLRGPMDNMQEKPLMRALGPVHGLRTVHLHHPFLGDLYYYVEGADELLFTENETNRQELFGKRNRSHYVKDGFHRFLIEHDNNAINPDKNGTKCCAVFRGKLGPGEQATHRFRLQRKKERTPFADFDDVLAQRKAEADEFYAEVQNPKLSEEEKQVQRLAFAGLMWNKQLYYYDVDQWLEGDPALSPPPESRLTGRNHDWINLVNFDVMSMPDAWEYPWYAGWDLAFHCIPIAIIDSDYAKRQLILLTREWYMHTNGQIPAYEWSFSDVNPPVHAWATWRVYQIDHKYNGTYDRAFLEGSFHKLLLNFTWWVNRKDIKGNNIFQGGFLGLDNISIFDRSKELPEGGYIDQSDGTAWMGFYCVSMVKIALELAKENPIYQDSATKFLEHFLRIAEAMTNVGGKGYSLWNEEDGFFYDVLHLPDGTIKPLKVRSLVGLIPLLAVETLDRDLLETMSVFKRRLDWYTHKHADASCNIQAMFEEGDERRRLVAFLSEERLLRILYHMLNEDEFLSPHGIRAVSKIHEEHPVTVEVGGESFSIDYQPAESTSGLFGGNSNWRGPIWFPLNYLLIEALQRFHHYFGDDFKVECPTGSGIHLTLWEVAEEISHRLMTLFKKDSDGRRPIYGGTETFQTDPHWKDLILFNEYFHGDNGAGLGATHQTGWTGVVAKLIQQSGGETSPSNIRREQDAERTKSTSHGR